MSPTTRPLVWFGFGNGTDDPSYNTCGIMGSSSDSVPIQTFFDNITPLQSRHLTGTVHDVRE